MHSAQTLASFISRKMRGCAESILVAEGIPYKLTLVSRCSCRQGHIADVLNLQVSLAVGYDLGHVNQGMHEVKAGAIGDDIVDGNSMEDPSRSEAGTKHC